MEEIEPARKRTRGDYCDSSRNITGRVIVANSNTTHVHVQGYGSYGMIPPEQNEILQKEQCSKLELMHSQLRQFQERNPHDPQFYRVWEQFTQLCDQPFHPSQRPQIRKLEQEVYHLIQRLSSQQVGASEIAQRRSRKEYPLEARQALNNPTVEGFYLCPYPECIKKYSKRESFIRHLNFHYFPLKCRGCGIAFGAIDKLKRHEKICKILNPEGSKCFQCRFCLKYFTRKSNMFTHILKVHKELPYQCSKCLERFETNGEFKDHEAACYRSDEILRCGERIFSSNKYCKNLFNSEEQLKRHKERCHDLNNPRPFYCEEFNCHCGYVRECDLRHHINKKHPQEKKVKCLNKECMERFATIAVRNQHILRMHPVEDALLRKRARI
eukprot:TRINITY_DN302134_c0_g1_i1.p1 TRINITY_DN302134_c0_g1~~TRINITY_DN302134_c0_g1_i1.p1  ORF type:complete len:383 (-),score=26.06 TRINITY_DN302134_c0_g1_i1:137-1285(-)